MGKHNILVVGDACIDKFVYCKCERLCPEAPVPVLDIIRTVQNPGMAGNVIANIASLNKGCSFDINSNCDLITKTRYVEERSNHMFIRIDHTEPIEKFKNWSIILNTSWDAVVISDYCKGFLSEQDIQKIAENSKLTFLDTKKKLGAWAKPVTYININRKEFNDSLAGIAEHGLEDKIIQTLGPEGASYRGKLYPVEEVEVKDLSGAGDTFLAGLVFEFLNTGDMEKAIVFANECSTKVVQKKGVSCI